MFYSYTGRSDDAVRCFDEIGLLFFGFKLTDYSLNPTSSMDKRYAAEDRIKQGASFGPPFTIPDSDLKYVGYAIYHTVDLRQKAVPRAVNIRLYRELYMDWFLDQHPEACDKGVTELVETFMRRR